jgi:hypothetical protein
MIRLAPLFLLLIAATPLHAQGRLWRNADNSSTFRGEYLSQDQDKVSIRRADGRVFTLEIDRLHPDDRRWISERQAMEKPGEDAAPDPGAVFDTLHFGDTRQQVEDKLKKSAFVETTIDETFFGRLGLNGTFRTRRQIGGLHCELYFGWTPDGSLNEITLQTQPLGPDSYDSSLKDNWSELIKVLSQLHGKPVQSGDYPGRDKMQNDLFLASHLWRLENGGSALLGTSMQAERYLVVVRFTTEKIEPVRKP